jgi:hypothetical protein
MLDHEKERQRRLKLQAETGQHVPMAPEFQAHHDQKNQDFVAAMKSKEARQKAEAEANQAKNPA